MRYVNPEAITYRIEFVANGKRVVPDANSVKVTIRAQAANIVTGWDHTAVDHQGKDFYLLGIPAPVNSIIYAVEKRTIVINFKFDGADYRLLYYYMVTDWIDTVVGVPQVTQFLGLEVGSIPDDLIEVEKAYIYICNRFTKNEFDAALADFDRMHYANDMILAQAAMFAIDSVKNLMMHSETSDQESYTRFDHLDLDSLRAKAVRLYTDGADKVFSRSAVAGSDIFSVSVATDVVTGV